MEKDIVDGKIGEVVLYDLEFKGGSLVARVEIPASKVIDLICEKIPGKVDDAILGVLKAALLGE